jgi:Acetyltransferase (isoleucine patch superfamily)
VYSHSFFNAIGVNHECVLRTLSPEARIIAGTDVGMSGCSICAVRAITIGDRVLLANVAIIDSDLHVLPHLGEVSPGSSDGALDTLAAPVVIGNDVFIGMNSVVLKGVTIGSNSVIGAGSTVVDDVPPWSLVGGVPARVLRVLDKTDDGAAGEES